MTKIYYVVSARQDEEVIRQIERELNVEVLIQQVDEEAARETLQNFVQNWEKDGAEVILCKGALEKKIRPFAESSYVMGVQFSFDTALSNLEEYRKKNPGFFAEGGKKVLMLSSQRLLLNHALLWDLYHVHVTNKSADEFRNAQELASFASGFDLVIAGQKWIPLWKQHGIPYFFQTLHEDITLHENLKMADMIAVSRRQLREKNETIQNILDNSFHAMLSVGRDGLVHSGNGRVRQYLKCDLSRIIGSSVYELIPQLKPDMMERAFETGRGFYGELVEFDGSILVMNSFLSFPKGKERELVLNFEELQRIARVEQKIKSKFLEKGLVAKYHFSDILGESEAMKRVREYAKKFAMNSSNVLIYGESGTGKELFAQSIHNHSARQNGPFVAVNCGALPDELLESELFGYVEGAFTGASRNGKTGLVESASKGTIFLDEISEMNLKGQVRLLRVLEERALTRVGDDRVIPVDVRIIAASNKDLIRLVEEGKFREDLYYRLNVLMLKIPPLRERGNDVLLLTERFLADFGRKNKKQVELSGEAKRIVAGYPWRGNVRQLRNFCERLVIIAETRTVSAEFVRGQMEERLSDHVESRKQETDCQERGEAEENMAELRLGKKESPETERKKILAALNKAGGRRERAAEILGISKVSLWRKMKQYEIEERY